MTLLWEFNQVVKLRVRKDLGLSRGGCEAKRVFFKSGEKSGFFFSTKYHLFG